jgi:hypothetical protein
MSSVYPHPSSHAAPNGTDYTNYSAYNVQNSDDEDSNANSDIDADGDFVAQSDHAPSDHDQAHSSHSGPSLSRLAGKSLKTDYSADPNLYGLRRSVRSPPRALPPLSSH